MNKTNFKTRTILLLFATLLMGLLAGVFFTWTNAVTPGIGKLNDLSYLQSFQHLNRTILNPLFYIVFMGSMLLSAGAAFYFKKESKLLFRLIIAATLIHFTGDFLVTLLGNLPLNDILDKTNLENLSILELKALRDGFEVKWNILHLVRTISSTSAFFILITVSLLDKNK